MKKIRVRVIAPGDRKYYQLRWTDPVTGRTKCKTTDIEQGGSRQRQEACNAAAVLADSLMNGRYKEPSRVAWKEFRDRYESEHLSSLADSTIEKSTCVLRAVDRHCKPEKLSELTSARVSYFQNRLRDEGLSENTINGYLLHLGAALRWAVKMRLMHEAPIIERPKHAGNSHSRVMIGRPITAEEFMRMLIATVEVVGEDCAEDWRHYLEGLWWSGLRLGESLELCWDRDDRLSVDMSGEYPMLKSPTGRDPLFPIAPEFAQLLQAIPAAERHGRVFKLRSRRDGTPLGRFRVSELMSAIGQAAEVKVSTYPKSGKVKYASAADLRMSFCERWSQRVSGPLLMKLMRYASMETTAKHCNSQSAKESTKAVWDAYQKGWPTWEKGTRFTERLPPDLFR